MTITHTLKSFHIRAQQLKKQLGSGKEAWIQTEIEYLEKTGKNRYHTYLSYRVNHCNWLKSLKK